MPKSKLDYSIINASLLTDVPLSRVYAFPQSFTFDNLGRIISISTSAGSLSQVTTSTGITISTSTGSIVVGLLPIVSAGTYSPASQITVNSFGQATSISGTTLFSTATTYNNPNSVTVNTNGALLNITTVTDRLLYTGFTSTILQNYILTGTTTLVGGSHMSMNTTNEYQSGSGNYVFDLNSGTVFSLGLASYSIFYSWTPSFINVPTYSNRLISATILTAMYQGNPSFGSYMSFGPTNTISVNSSTVPLKWVNGKYPSTATSGLSNFQFTFRYTGGSFVVYANMLEFK